MATETPDIKVDARRLSPTALEDLRKHGIELLKAGVSQTEVARRLKVHRQCVVRWVKRMRELPEEQAFLSDKRGPKEQSRDNRRILTKSQQEVVRQKIIDKNPAQLKFEFALWTLKAIKMLVLRLYQVELSTTTLRRYLKAWGMSSQRPDKRAIQQDPERIQKWLEEDYPAIARKAKAEDAIIFWQDETGIHQDTNWVRGFAPVGRTPHIEHNARLSHGYPSMLSAVSNQGKLHFSFHKGAVSAEVFLKFLQDLVQDHPQRKVFVITDNAKIHHARIVTEWLDANKERIELFFLPPYAPEHNPDEYLNRQVKTNLRLKPTTGHDKAIERTMELLKRMQEFGGALVKKLFDSPLVQYARSGVNYNLLAISYSK